MTEIAPPRASHHLTITTVSLLPIVGFALGMAVPAAAEDSTQPLAFVPGVSSTRVTGTVGGDDTAIYTLDARGGQAMSVQLAASGSVACIFNVEPPNGPSLFNGSIDGDRFTGRLPTDGSYSIEVFQMRAAILERQTCRFTLTVGID